MTTHEDTVYGEQRVKSNERRRQSTGVKDKNIRSSVMKTVNPEVARTFQLDEVQNSQ